MERKLLRFLQGALFSRRCGTCESRFPAAEIVFDGAVGDGDAARSQVRRALCPISLLLIEISYIIVGKM